MKRILFIISVCFAAIATTAQTADIDVCYKWNYYNRNGKMITLTMNLLAGSELSQFCNRNSAWVDSIRSTPEGLQNYKDMCVSYFEAGKMSSLPSKVSCIYIYKDFSNEKTTVYDGIENLGDYRFKYEEPLEKQEWEIVSDSTDNILGYECIMAECSWRGRNWKAWFTPEIPLSDGPWKLCGLPGLILKAEDSTKQHIFTATGIENSNKKIAHYEGHLPSEKVSRKQMLKTLRKYYEDPVGVSNAINGGLFAGEKSDPISPLCEFPETDYKTK